MNAFFQRNSLGAAFRLIPVEIKTIDELGLPRCSTRFCQQDRAGSSWSPGPTGSGKSTTLAAIIDEINSARHDHIMTIEDPIEFLHRHKKCIINQREVGADTKSFNRALKSVLRQDPDVILVGEMRDLETIQTALTAAETGHLVFATLHTQDCPQTIDRMIDVFPPHQQEQIRVQIASTIQGIVTQQLLPAPDGRGRCVRLRSPDPDSGRPQPDPGRQDPPDLHGHADGHEVRHADDGLRPGRSGAPQLHHEGTGREAVVQPGGSEPAPHDRSGMRSVQDQAPAH